MYGTALQTRQIDPIDLGRFVQRFHDFGPWSLHRPVSVPPGTDFHISSPTECHSAGEGSGAKGLPAAGSWSGGLPAAIRHGDPGPGTSTGGQRIDQSSDNFEYHLWTTRWGQKHSTTGHHPTENDQQRALELGWRQKSVSLQENPSEESTEKRRKN